MFIGDRARQVILVPVDQLQQLVHQPGAADRRHVGPGGKRRLGGRNSRVHIRFGGQADLAADPPRGRIENILGSAARAGSDVARNKVPHVTLLAGNDGHGDRPAAWIETRRMYHIFRGIGRRIRQGRGGAACDGDAKNGRNDRI